MAADYCDSRPHLYSDTTYSYSETNHHPRHLDQPPVSPLLPAQRLPELQTRDRYARNHDLIQDLVSPIAMSRSPSIASDSRFSALSAGTAVFPLNPANVRPQPAYVAPFGAVQVVTENYANGRHLEDDDDDDDDNFDAVSFRPGKEDVTFTPAALALINAFLDQLLFSFLSAAKSTSIAALRPAVTDLLKGKLARDAISSADIELSDLLAGGDDEEDKKDDGNKWDLELIWKRTRLRVMVYMRLGEMEDGDEELHVKQQSLHVNGEQSRFTSTSGLVSWSTAIFLTSVLEYVAEQTIRVAGAAAIARTRRRPASAAGRVDTSPDTPSIIVDEQDAERIALNPALGRLWRSWRKNMRANVRPPTPPQLREIATVISPPKSPSSKRDSFGTAPESAHEDEADMADRLADHPPDTHHPEHVLASNIRLPMGDALRDVDEIEVPGLARDPSEAGSEAGLDEALPERRNSFSNYQSSQAEAKALSSSPAADDLDDEAPKLKRRRSSSVPAAVRRSVFLTRKPKPELVAQSKAESPGVQDAEGGEADALINDVDNRKSLIDIKTLLAAIDGGFAAFRGTTKLDTVEDRPSSSDSAGSFTLNNKDTASAPAQPLTEHRHITADRPNSAQIGVATTSDEAVAPARGPSAQGNRGTPSPIPNLSRNASIARSKYSPNNLEIDTAGVSQRDRPIVPSEKTLAVLQDAVQQGSGPQTRVPNGAPVSGDSSPESKRKSLVSTYGPISAFSNQAQYWQVHRSQQGSGDRSPVLDSARVVSPIEPVVTPVVRRSQVNALTAASIRGPQDFDQLVQSEEVVKYTLTPESIRETPKSDAAALALLTGEVPPAVANKDNVGVRTIRSEVNKSVIGTGTSTDELTALEKKRNRYSVTKPPSRNSSVHRKSGLMARDARVITESTRDFADFIRSTRPDKEPQVVPFATNRSSVSLSNRNSTNYSLPRTSSFTGDRTRSLTKSDIAAGHAPPMPSLPANGKSSMIPKAAQGNEKTNTGELAAFIRDGPSRQHAYRNTMGSELANEFKTSHPVNGSLSNRESTIASTHASTHSRTPLMSNPPDNGVAHPAYSGGVKSLSALTSNPTSKVPERTRYRNKDPYAIDLSDDDDDEDVSALPRGKRGGESLADFLRSTESTKDSDGSKPIASASSLAQARELRERARASVVTTTGNRRGSYYENTALPLASDATSLPPVSRGHTAAAANLRPRAPVAGRAGDRLGLGGSSTTTKELADFLRNSGPAPAPAVSRGTQSASSAQQKTNKEKVVKEKKSKGLFSFLRRSPSRAKV